MPNATADEHLAEVETAAAQARDAWRMEAERCRPDLAALLDNRSLVEVERLIRDDGATDRENQGE